MTSPIEPRTASLYHASRAPAVEPGIAAGIVAAAVATYLLVPIFVPSGAALLVAQAALLAAPVAAVLIAHPARPLAALGLRGARPRWFACAIGLGATLWYVNLRLVALLPTPARDARALEAIVVQPPLLHALALFALVPALCEEVLFRGVLARALGRRLPLAGAAALSALVFAAYHLSVVQALPTLTFGCALAVIAIRADSVAPTIVAHALNNAIAIAMTRGALPDAAAWLTAHPTAALAGASVVSAIAVAAAARGAT